MNEVCENKNQVVKEKIGSKAGRKIILAYRDGRTRRKKT
jgi:hypothetical protein